MNFPTPSRVVDVQSSSCLKDEDCSDPTLKFITEMLMEEENLDNKRCMLHDCLAAQAAQMSFNNALNNGGECHEDDISKIVAEWAQREKIYHDQLPENVDESLELPEDMDESLEMYDDVLLSTNTTPPPMQTLNTPRSKGGRRKKTGCSFVKEPVDLKSLLAKCAEAVSKLDFATANDTLAQIRLNSFPKGDGQQRFAHYIANALEARLNGTGPALFYALNSRRRSASEVLRSYKMAITSCPYRKMSGLLANKAIEKLAAGATTLHIIDFGILYGFQWPSLIQMMSTRHGGPPRLRITGIEFPQSGNHPAEAVEETGRRLAKYCERFGVPFEYKAIAQNWETIRVEDLRIERDELLVVNSLFRLHNLLDETVIVDSPRDAVLNLIKNINPAMFVHGVSNGQYSAPFFSTRFPEALFHLSSMFDMLEATVPREDEDRVVFEEHVLGTMAMNVLACEGRERIQRPETYKQWEVRMRRAGFRQARLDKDVVGYVRRTVKMGYHKNFIVDEDGKWLLLGWKGRVNEAMSIWQPSHN